MNIWKATLCRVDDIFCMCPEDQWVNGKGRHKGHGVLGKSGLGDS